MRRKLFIAWSGIMVGALSVLGALTAKAEDSAALREVFANPPRDYSSGPLWVWNDLLTEDQIRGTLRDLAAQDVKQAWVHPRPGLMTPYLSPEWFKLWKAALDEAEKLDMNIWIYDENSYPSGFAGGYVPEAMPESRGQGLNLNEDKQPGAWSPETVAVYRIDGDKATDISAAVRAGEKQPEGKYVTATVSLAKPGPWYGNKWYVDLTHPGVTQKFLEITMDAYQREIGGQFGKRVPGVFTDEPHLAPGGGLHWTPDLPQVFKERRGYDLVPNLPSLTNKVGDWKRVRRDYFETIQELFIERWAKPYYDYCTAHNLEFTGHYWEHSWPNCVTVPDNMAMAAWQHRPGIDCLFNQYAEDVHAQFGNVRSVIELASVADQLGRKRTLCETYGGAGWDCRFEDQKRIADFLNVLGVSTTNQHLSFVTLRGARKHDYPPTFSYHEPWWSEYHSLGKYLARMTAAVSFGERVHSILMIEPTTTAWMYQTKDDKPHVEEMGQAFQKLVTDLAKAQVEFDLGSEDIIARNGEVKDKGLRVGHRTYDVVVLPPLMETLNASTVTLLEQYVKNGGNLIVCDGPPLMLVDGAASDRATALAKDPACKQVASADLAAALFATRTDGFRVKVTSGDKSIVYHQRRQYNDGEMVYVVNTNIETPATGEIVSPMKNVESWSLETGKVNPYPFTKSDDGVRAAFNLPPSGSLLLFFSKKSGDPVPAPTVASAPVAATGDVQITRNAPNVLTVDYADITANGVKTDAQFFLVATKLAFNSVGLENNPWDHAVQYRDEMLAMKLPADKPIEITYHFTIEGAVPKKLEIGVERPDLYAITCNGKAVSPIPNVWWLDRAFGKVDVSGVVVTGENTFTLKAPTMTVFTEIEPIYVLGAFTVKPAEKGFVIAPDAPLALGAWNAQGHPLYSGGVTYAQTFEVSKPEGQYVVEMPDWYGSVARVKVNGTDAGQIAWKPFECNVTSLIKAGKNVVEIEVIGTNKNMMGPHHENPPLGIASPEGYHHAPSSGPPAGAEYSTIAYGLMKPFALTQRK